MSASAYFVSDVHLGAGPTAVDAARERDFVTFIERLEGGDRLYLLGDIFDFWFDFGGSPPNRYGPILRAIGRATGRGVEVSFMGGNHDHWARTSGRPGYLERVLGVTLLEDPTRVEIEGSRLLLTHGDALGGAHGTYAIVRRVLRHRLPTIAFRLVPQRLGYWLGARISRTSRGQHAGEALEAHGARLRAAATRVIADEALDGVIAGHIHHPEQLELGAGRYINLGDWISHRTYAQLTDRDLSLKHFEPIDR
jgi:UDP-2,3-diacylglucosamine hydrolase